MSKSISGSVFKLTVSLHTEMVVVSLLLLSWRIYFSGKDSHLIFIYLSIQRVVKGFFLVCVIAFICLGFLKKKHNLKIHCPLPPQLCYHFLLSSLIFSILFLNYFITPSSVIPICSFIFLLCYILSSVEIFYSSPES